MAASALVASARRLQTKWNDEKGSGAMILTISKALLTIAVTLLRPFIAGWHRESDGKQATIRMVTLHALPLSLFAGLDHVAHAPELEVAP